MNVDQAIAFLNEVLELDRGTISTLVCGKPIFCAVPLHLHPTVQVSGYGVRMLGILNGMFGVRRDGYGHITAVIGDDGRVERFESTSISRGAP